MQYVLLHNYRKWWSAAFCRWSYWNAMPWWCLWSYHGSFAWSLSADITVFKYFPPFAFIYSFLNCFFLSLFVRWRSLKSSWRALRPWGCSATKRATTRPSRTKRMEMVQTASWGKDRSRYDMTSPFSQPWPPWLIADKHLCHNRCRIPYDQWSLLEEYVMDK